MNLQQRHLDELISDYTGYLIDLYRGCERTTDSPIEALMLWSLYHVCRGERFGMASGNEVPEDIPEEYDFFVIKQARIAKYKADFAVLARYVTKTHRLIIECDGHDFHNITKAQAEHDRSRDRYMTDNGWKVFRFTGSEIYRSPLACATSVLHSAWRASYDD